MKIGELLLQLFTPNLENMLCPRWKYTRWVLLLCVALEGVQDIEENVALGSDTVHESSLVLDSGGLSINQRKINRHVETVSLNCILTTISIYFSLPFNILGNTHFGLENKSEFVDEIQLHGCDGVHKSSEFNLLEFSQIEIKCSHSCPALKFQVSSICRHTQPACDISARGYHSVRTM